MHVLHWCLSSFGPASLLLTFFLTGFSFLLRLLPSDFRRRESISTGCCRDTITGKCKLFYFLCQPIQQSGYHLIHPRLFQLCFKLITGSYKFLIILTFFHIFHICKSLSLIFPYVKRKQDTFRVICLLLPWICCTSVSSIPFLLLF